MNPLTETLRQEAENLSVDDPAARVLAVRRRARGVRRRRVAASTVAVAAVLATVVGVAVGAQHLRTPTPRPADHAPRTVFGRTVPQTTTVLGATYTLVAVHAHGNGRLGMVHVVDDATVPIVVRFASQNPEGTLHVTSSSMPGRVWDLPAGKFGPALYNPGTSGPGPSVSVTQNGPAHTSGVAVAVYKLTRLPAGVGSGHPYTYPDAVAASRLMGAAVGRNKVRTATGRLTTRAGWGTLDVSCIATSVATNAYQVQVTSGGRQLYRGPCAENGLWHEVDAATYPTSQLHLTPADVAKLGPTITVRLVRGPGSSGGTLEQSAIGAAVYTDPDQGATPRQVQVDGHLWQLTGTRVVGATFSGTIPGSGRRLVAYAVTPATTAGRLTIGGLGLNDSVVAQVGRRTISGWVQVPEVRAYPLQVHYRGSSGKQVWLAFYRQVG